MREIYGKEETGREGRSKPEPTTRRRPPAADIPSGHRFWTSSVHCRLPASGLRHRPQEKADEFLQMRTCPRRRTPLPRFFSSRDPRRFPRRQVAARSSRRRAERPRQPPPPPWSFCRRGWKQREQQAARLHRMPHAPSRPCFFRGCSWRRRIGGGGEEAGIGGGGEEAADWVRGRERMGAGTRGHWWLGFTAPHPGEKEGDTL